MARTADPNLKPTQPVTTYLTESELALLDRLAARQGRVSRAAILRWLLIFHQENQ